MPQGKIRKGFFFYFGLFVLFIIAVFLIILVILMFNPGKTILWFQYFTPSENEFVITETTDGRAIDLSSSSSIKTIKVESSYANVNIQKGNDVRKDAVIIKNEAKGFALASDATPFSYEVILNETGDILTVKVTEPTGFLYLSDNISITFNIFYNEDYNKSSGNFENLDFEITTTSGNVDIGAGTYINQTISPKSITAKTTSGDIIFRESAKTLNMQTLSLQTVDGDILAPGNNETYNSQKVSGIVKNNGSIFLKTTNGTIDLSYVVINENGTLNIENEKGNIVIDNIFTKYTGINCYEGNYIFKNIQSEDFTFTPASDRIASPNIQIDKIEGRFSISSNADKNTANLDVVIKKLVGEAYISEVNGSISINELDGFAYSEMMNGNINVTYINQEKATEKGNTFIAENGATINITFLGKFSSRLDARSQSGNIVFNYKSDTNFVASSFINDGINYGDPDNPELLPDDKISVNVGSSGTKNPFYSQIGSEEGQGTLNIYTNAKVSFNLV